MKFKDKFREWLSDNLRYIVLIVCLAAVVGLVAVGVHFLPHGSDKAEGTNKSAEGQEVSVAGDKKTDTASSTDGSAGNTADTASSTDGSTGSSADADSPADESSGKAGQSEGALSETENTAVRTLMNTYFDALGKRDITALQGVVADLDSKTKKQISAEDKIEAYSDIDIHAFKGQIDDTYVVFAGYKVKFKGIDTLLPGLTQFNLQKDKDGDPVIITKGGADADYVKELKSRPQMKELIEQTNAAYKEAKSGDKKLAELLG